MKRAISVIFGLLISINVNASRCIHHDGSTLEKYEANENVLHVLVTKAEYIPTNDQDRFEPEVKYSLEIKQAFKGNQSSLIHNLKYPCLMTIQVGMEYLLFFSGEQVGMYSGSMSLVERIRRGGYVYSDTAVEILNELSIINAQ